MNMQNNILKLYNEVFFMDPEFRGTFDDLPLSLQEMVVDWEHGYKTLGGNLDMCSRQIAALLFLTWEQTHEDEI